MRQITRGGKTYVVRGDKVIEVEVLELGGPAKKRKATEPFVIVPWWWITPAAKATHSPRTLVLIELLYASWRAKSTTFPLPNARLNKVGVHRKFKLLVLRDLERAGLIKVVRRHGKTPTITLIGF
jgi:hypothetical protein